MTKKIPRQISVAVMSRKDTLRGGEGGHPFLPLRCRTVRKVFPEQDHFGAQSHRCCSPSTSRFRHTFNAQFKSSLSKLNVSKSAVWDQCAICFGFLREGEKKKKTKTMKCWNRPDSCRSREIVPQLFNAALWAAPRLPWERTVRVGRTRSFSLH